MKPPLPGMKTIPLYYGTPKWDALIGPAWVGLIQYALSIDYHRAAFQRETGHSLDALVAGGPLAAMIDKATGRTDTIMAAWCDWVTVNLWGEES